ncbi:autophagy-related protein 16-1-like [Paramacrobiotus metropolitanus]|uniref:autophagy-related protein 16-1-like n=1 Tax=Paramacrobiotus metropolitanus TaxID=2943436 RepID=UPI002445B897|nr:autophagy-related protein 16-1-like [Paramacrobiotus metropolitanus]
MSRTSSLPPPSTNGWKVHVLQKLKKRNRTGEDFRPVFDAYGKLFELAESLKVQNKQLQYQVEKSKDDTQRNGFRGGNVGDPDPAEKISMLEQKVYRLQEELTEMHKRKGDNAQQLVDMRAQLEEKEMTLHDKDRKIRDQEDIIYNIQQAISNSEVMLLDLEHSNRLLKDEQQALNAAYSCIEEKHRKLEQEYEELIGRWLKLKADEAEEKNREAESFVRRRKSSMLEEIIKHIRQPVKVNIDESDGWEEVGISSVYCVSVPSFPQLRLDAHESEVNAVKWSSTGRFFATGGADKKVKLWDSSIPTRPECRGILTGPNAAVMSVDFDPGENLVMAASSDFAVHLWTIFDLRLKHKLTGHKEKVLSSKFISGPNRVVSGSYDRTLKLWDLRSGACTQNFFAGSSCNDVVVCGSQTILSGHFDGKIRYWDTRCATSVNELALQGKLTSLDLSPDGFYVLTCSRDDTLSVVDVRMREVTMTLSAENFRVGRDWSRAVFSPDGQYVMAGSNDGVLYVWNVRNREGDYLEKMLKEHPTTITGCSWHPQGSQLLTGDRSQRVIVWGDMEIRG